MPASLRASQLLWTVFEGWLALWLLQKTWLVWTVCALWLATTLGLAGLLQQVGSLVDAQQTTCDSHQWSWVTLSWHWSWARLKPVAWQATF